MKKVIIIGAGVAGKDVLREIKNDSGLGLKVVAFIDDDQAKVGGKVDGVKVVGTQKELGKILRKESIHEVIIAIPSASGGAISDYVKICSNAKVNFRIVPRVKEIIEGKAHVKTLRKPRVEDLVGRPVIKTDVRSLKRFFQGKKVLVAGAAGSIGSELSRQIVAYNPLRTLLLDWWENGLFELEGDIAKSFPGRNVEYVIANIQDERKMGRIFEYFKPDYVFHAAAYKHVPLMEEHPDEAIKNNVFGTLNLVKAAYKNRTKRFVIVSTDKAAVPRSVMGVTKLITEALGRIYNKRGKTKFIAVRFGNVLDSFGSVIPTFRKQIEEGGPVTITDRRMTRYFMTIPEAAQLILKAALMGKGEELFVLDMGDPVRITDLAENIIRLSGLIPNQDIKIVYIGKRRGEKIRETLFNKKERTTLIKTKDKKIFITESLGVELPKVESALKTLKGLAEVGDKIYLRRELRKLVKSLPEE